MSENLPRRNRTPYHQQYYLANKQKKKKQRNARISKLRKASGRKLCECGCRSKIYNLTYNLTAAKYKNGHGNRKSKK